MGVAHLGRGFQAALQDLQLLPAGGQFVLQVLENILLLLRLKRRQNDSAVRLGSHEKEYNAIDCDCTLHWF